MHLMKKSLSIILLSILIFLNGCIGVNQIQISENLPNLESQNIRSVTEVDLDQLQTRECDGMKMVFVPAGQFIMGNDGSDTCPFASPAHAVALDAYWIDQMEVTNVMFTRFLNEEGNQTQNGVRWFEPGAGHRGITYGYIEENDEIFSVKEGYDDFPVIEVSWYGAAAYCSWVGGRLPTEAEWEYAARGPDGNRFPWGNNFNGEFVNYCDSSCQQSWNDDRYDDGSELWTISGHYPEGASWCNAYDMAGNIWEWVNDWWSEDYYSISPQDNPEGPVVGALHIARGGSWYDEWWRMDSTCRKGLTPSSARMHWVGFRCVWPGEE